MAYVLNKIVSFGASKAGLSTVAYQLFNADGTNNGPRVTESILDIGGGQYSALVTFPDSFQGIIKWDSGEDPPVYVSEEINPRTVENVNAKFSTRPVASEVPHKLSMLVSGGGVLMSSIWWIGNRRNKVKKAESDKETLSAQEEAAREEEKRVK